jgi:carboxymethylenebutenolidase
MPRTQATLETPDGRPQAYVFTPDTSDGPWPAVLFFMDGRGIRPALFEMGERIAKAGYYVLLPDLFYRAGPYESPGPRAFSEDPELRKQWAAKYTSSVTKERARSDTHAFLDFLAKQPQVSSPFDRHDRLLHGRWLVAIGGGQLSGPRDRCSVVPRRQPRE